jgi:hypothetical protein
VSVTDRSKGRKPRITGHRVPNLGYYSIVTDTNETEKNYLYGLRDSLPKDVQSKIAIVVHKAETSQLIDVALMQPQFAEKWIIFDRDEVINFDKIIDTAQSSGVSVGWSNPCIEIWFSAYFGEMPSYNCPKACCKGFEKWYCKVTGKKEYNKADDKIYSVLCDKGNEQKAIALAEQKLREHEDNGKVEPSEKQPATTVHLLVKEIKNKVNGPK